MMLRRFLALFGLALKKDLDEALELATASAVLLSSIAYIDRLISSSATTDNTPTQ